MAYSIGVDFGTQSGRVVLLDLETACEVALSVVPYPHGVIDDVLPTSGEKLPPDWALQHPLDYMEVLLTGIPDVVRQAGVSSRHIVGIGIDFTSCTVLPVTGEGTPLCLLPEWGKAQARVAKALETPLRSTHRGQNQPRCAGTRGGISLAVRWPHLLRMVFSEAVGDF